MESINETARIPTNDQERIRNLANLNTLNKKTNNNNWPDQY